MPKGQPTHRVTHTRTGREAHLYIAPSLQDKLGSPNPIVREGAESSVAISFKHACHDMYGTPENRYVNFNDLQIDEINRQDEPSPIRITQGGQPDDCDECGYCEDGDHWKCVNGNCVKNEE